MRKAMSITLVLVLALAGAAAAKTVDQTGTLDKIQYMDLTGRPASDFAKTSHAGVFSAAVGGTTYYGGTVWAADSARWEAIEGGEWTFESGVGSSFVPGGGPSVVQKNYGVDPNKAATLHAEMEGWVGFDRSFSAVSYFRRLSTASTPCVGSGVGLGGSWSFFCGALPSEAAALCFANVAGGYGNSWNVCMGQQFTVSSTGNVTLSFSYHNDSEPGYDYTYVYCDTSGAGDDVELVAYDGPVTGSASLTLHPGTELRSDNGPIVIKFCCTADGAYSDEDGNYTTSCGMFAVDNINVSGGGITSSADFESGAGGWAYLQPAPGAGGEWTDIKWWPDLPAKLTPCDCTLSDTVLVMFDPDLNSGNPGHPFLQDNVAASPWIDLGPDGYNNRTPGKFINYHVYAFMPIANFCFGQFEVQWYPDVCTKTGKLLTSPWTNTGFVRYFGEVPTCTTAASALDGGSVEEFSEFIPNGAEQVRIGLGVVNYCRYYPNNCDGGSNETPVWDDVRLGTYGNPEAPYINAGTIDVPFDSFPQNGTLNANAPGRLDCNNIKGAGTPEVGTSLGDTLIVNGAVGGAEVWVDFAVRPGPGIDTGRLNSWLSSHMSRGSHDGQNWYTARMDTAEQGASGAVDGTWCTMYIEPNPVPAGVQDTGTHGYTGTDRTTDPNDLDPNGQQSRPKNDIFPDDLFTPGTHVSLFYRTKYTNHTDVEGNWFEAPDTTGGGYYEMEVLPSSMADDGNGGYEWNCTLYVDHFDGRGAQNYIEPALANELPGGSGNFENTAWDRWDVRAPSSQQCSFGRPFRTQYGATLTQTFAYRDIVWNSGDLPSFNLMQEDGDVLTSWLEIPDTTPGFGGNDIYFSGNGLVTSPFSESATEASAAALLSNNVGVSLRCATYRLATCPPGGNGVLDDVDCIPLAPVGTSPMTHVRADTHTGQGNGCPSNRSFDVINALTPKYGTTSGDEDYNGNKTDNSGVIHYSAVVTDAQTNPTNHHTYRIVTDGLSIHYRRTASGACAFAAGDASSVDERMHEVATYLGLTTTACSDILAGTGIPVGQDRQPQFRTTLFNFAPNPLVAGGTGHIQFSMAKDGKAQVDIFDVEGRLVKTVFNGLALEGINDAYWNGTDGTGNQVANGVYFYRLRANSEDLSKKMVVVRNGGN